MNIVTALAIVIGALAAVAKIGGGTLGAATIVGVSVVVLGEPAAVFKAAVITVVSMIVGNIFGYVSEIGAGTLAKS